MLLTLVAFGFTGCSSTSSRIAQQSETFEALDAETQRKIKSGVIEPGYTSAMVFLALGRPTRHAIDQKGNAIWIYQRQPITGPNETVAGGFVRRRVYNPVKRADDVVVEAVDEKAFPHLVPRTLRVTFRNDRVSAIDEIKG